MLQPLYDTVTTRWACNDDSGVRFLFECAVQALVCPGLLMFGGEEEAGCSFWALAPKARPMYFSRVCLIGVQDKKTYCGRIIVCPKCSTPVSLSMHARR